MEIAEKCHKANDVLNCLGQNVARLEEDFWFSGAGEMANIRVFQNRALEQIKCCNMN